MGDWNQYYWRHITVTNCPAQWIRCALRGAIVINHKVKLGEIYQQGSRGSRQNRNLGTVPKYTLWLNRMVSIAFTFSPPQDQKLNDRKCRQIRIYRKTQDKWTRPSNYRITITYIIVCTSKIDPNWCQSLNDATVVSIIYTGLSTLLYLKHKTQKKTKNSIIYLNIICISHCASNP